MNGPLINVSPLISQLLTNFQQLLHYFFDFYLWIQDAESGTILKEEKKPGATGEITYDKRGTRNNSGNAIYETGGRGFRAD